MCVILRRALSKDKRAEPLVGERVPYVIVHGTPGLPLIQLVRHPHDLLRDPDLRLNITYYILKAILPTLNRAFSLMGVDVFLWYADLPRVLRGDVGSGGAGGHQESGGGTGGRGTISRYFASMSCPVCLEVTNSGTCADCRTDPQRVAVILGSRIRDTQRSHAVLNQVGITRVWDEGLSCIRFKLCKLSILIRCEGQ